MIENIVQKLDPPESERKEPATFISNGPKRKLFSQMLLEKTCGDTISLGTFNTYALVSKDYHGCLVVEITLSFDSMFFD